jgi:hypothetical protein
MKYFSEQSPKIVHDDHIKPSGRYWEKYLNVKILPTAPLLFVYAMSFDYLDGFISPVALCHPVPETSNIYPVHYLH